MINDAIYYMVNEEAMIDLVHGLSAYMLMLIILISFIALSKGADALIDGILHIAARLKVPMIFVGATILSLGTTTPEAFVSVLAAWTGNPGLALGNGVGSIICDTGLIFGLVCLLKPMGTNSYVLNRTGWVQVGAATLLVLIALIVPKAESGLTVLNRWVGILFLILLVGYLYLAYLWTQKSMGASPDETESFIPYSLMKSLFLFAGGLFLVVIGARLMVLSAAESAIRIGVPQDVVAVTLVAFGTSLPELATGIKAIRRNYPDIVVGNVVGADVLNCLFVIGAAATATPLAVPVNFMHFHFPAMLLILYTFRFFIYLSRHGKFQRWHGGVLLAMYLAYTSLQYIMM